jgi:hypothetical protein
MKYVRSTWESGAWLLALAMSAPVFASDNPTAAQPPMATRLCAALGDSLDAGMITRDLPGHGSFQADAPVNLGRSAAYRRQVASRVAHSHLATSAH